MSKLETSRSQWKWRVNYLGRGHVPGPNAANPDIEVRIERGLGENEKIFNGVSAFGWFCVIGLGGSVTSRGPASEVVFSPRVRRQENWLGL